MSTSVSLGRRTPFCPEAVDPREATATSATAPRIPSAVRSALRTRTLVSIAG